VEIEIEPIQNHLKFSNMNALNSSQYQSAIQMESNYFGDGRPTDEDLSQEPSKSREVNVSGHRKLHFSFDKNSLDQFFVLTRQEFKTQ